MIMIFIGVEDGTKFNTKQTEQDRYEHVYIQFNLVLKVFQK